MHDYDIILPDVSMIALEVTRHNVEDAIETQQAVDRRTWAFPSLRWSWSVKTMPALTVEHLHRNIARLLTELETAELTRVHVAESLDLRYRRNSDPSVVGLHDDEEHTTLAHIDSTGTWPVIEELARLGVRHAYMLSDAEMDDGHVTVLPYDSGGATGTTLVVDLAEHHADRKEKQLSTATTASERHLFVWVEHSRSAAVAAMRLTGFAPGQNLPRHAPLLPPSIDAVRTASAYDHTRLWSYHRRHGWCDHGIRTVDW